MFLDNPITGIGINNFKYLCEIDFLYKKLMVNYDCASHPHNIYIQWLTEGGIIVFASKELFPPLSIHALKRPSIGLPDGGP